MSKWEENVRKVVPYVPGEQPNRPKMIKLNTNENPYPPAPGVVTALKEFDTGRLQLYPDPTASVLVDAVANFYDLSSEQVFVGVGSDDVLAMIFLTFFNSKKPILFPDVTYSFYDVWADMLRIPYEMQPLDEKFQLQVADYQKENGGVIFANPNAPTGVLMAPSAVEQIIQENPDVIVIVDEAYIDFGGTSAYPLIEKYDNLIVVGTFSKSRSMAGSRIGYALAQPKLIKYLNDVKYSFNSYTMDQVTITIGAKAIADKKYFEETRNKIITTREWVKKELRKLGFVFEDSMSNFVFATHPKVPAEEIFEMLKQQDIYVRHFKKPERIRNYLRISIGTDAEMDRLINELRKILKR